MTPLWTAQSIADATGGTVHGDFDATGVTFDSREVGGGELFVAMPGQETDGHRFVGGAFENGAAGALVSRAVEGPHVRVEDTAAALNALARAARARAAARIVGVTGSAGKTGVKEALASALARHPDARVHRSVKSHNNHTGVPLSLARMPADSTHAVLEMGMNHPGELSALTALVRPNVALVTTIAPAHQEFFPSLDAIAEAKGEIFEGLEPDGVAIVPADSPQRPVLERAAAGHRLVTFGRAADADVRLIDADPHPHGGTILSVALGERSLQLRVAAPGEHWAVNALAVLAAVDAVGGDLAIAGLALAEWTPPAGRGERHPLRLPGGTAILIDESYNANPASMAATLAVLGAEPATRRIAVLGAMRELGAGSAAFHAALAGPVTDASPDTVVLVGEEMTTLADALLDTGVAVTHCADAAAASAALADLIAPGDVVLVKGSNGVGLDRVVRDRIEAA